MFPASNGSGGGTNFLAMAPRYVSGSTSSTTYITLVSVKGSGVLTSLFSYASTTGSGKFRVTLDGVITISNGSSSTANPTILSPMFGFNQSMLIEHSQSNAGGAVDTRATYILN